MNSSTAAELTHTCLISQHQCLSLSLSRPANRLLVIKEYDFFYIEASQRFN